jgi:hypothetical protein
MAGFKPLLYLSVVISGAFFILTVGLVAVATIARDSEKTKKSYEIWIKTFFVFAASWLLWAFVSLFVNPHVVHGWVLGSSLGAVIAVICCGLLLGVLAEDHHGVAPVIFVILIVLCIAGAFSFISLLLDSGGLIESLKEFINTLDAPRSR